MYTKNRSRGGANTSVVMAMAIGGCGKEKDLGRGRPGRIFKHDVAITSDQSGIFHPAPFIRRKRERRGVVVQPVPPLLSFRSPPTPALVRIINGQFAVSAADCIVSLFSGPPSVGWQTVFPLSRILFRLPPVFRLSRRLYVEWFSFLFFLQSTFRPFHFSPVASLHFKSGSKFVKTARAARGFGHLESLRLQNPFCCISSRTFSAPSRQEDRN